MRYLVSVMHKYGGINHPSQDRRVVPGVAKLKALICKSSVAVDFDAKCSRLSREADWQQILGRRSIV